jgi:predicted  nucleic acid-binding Zn-ribbon protein
MMSGREVDPELLGRLAERLEETGRTVKAFSAQNAQLSVQVSSLQTSVDSAHARLKGIEHTVNGNGGKGLKTELELAKKDIELAEDGVKALQKWREGLGDKKIEDLQAAQKEGRAGLRNTILTLAAIFIALGSMFASCGPQWFKAWGPADKGSTSAGH